MRILAESVPLPHAVLSGADWADRWSVAVPEAGLSASQAARRMLGGSPAWVRALMSLRNRIVSVFGLKAAGIGPDTESAIGGFPVVSERPERVVLGFDDSHLDFRIVVDVAREGASGSRVSVTTLVDRHNPFGRFYIAAVTPFHRAIVRGALRRLAAGRASFTRPE